MAWRDLFVPGSTQAKAFAEMCDERIATHTRVCINPSAEVEQIRSAQAIIVELESIAKFARGEKKGN